VSKALSDAGVKHDVVDHGEHNTAFRGGESTWRNSHHWVDIKVHPDAKITEQAEPIEEVSQGMLKSYLNKNARSQTKLIGKLVASSDPAERADILKKKDSRGKYNTLAWHKTAGKPKAKVLATEQAEPIEELFGSNPQADLHKHLAKLGYSRDGNTHTKTSPGGQTSRVETHTGGAKHTVTDKSGTVKNSSSYSFSSAKPAHIAGRVDYHSRSDATSRGDNTHREGYEPIEELSKATLGRYIRAATNDQRSLDDVMRRQNRSAEDAYNTNGISHKQRMDGVDYHNKQFAKSVKKQINRGNGLDKAIDKLTKENKED
jgi:hypothetical protein